MPRNGSDIYYVLPGTDGFPDTTIESAKYNAYIHDVEEDLNRPRPIVAGGTGADDADEALANLGAEKSSQQVTNYDSHVWIPGSFYSTASATGAPVAGRAFVGIVVSSDPPADPPANQNVVVHARDQNDVIIPGRLYVREKKAGVWGPWKPDGVSLYTSDTPPAEAPDNSLWWESDSGLLYVRYNDGAGVPQWVIACPQPDISALTTSPTFTGNPTAPTPDPGDNDTSIATTEFVSNAITTAVGGVPGAPSSVLRYDIPQTLTQTELVQARTNIYTPPYDTMSFNGVQINGAMEVSQEWGASATTTANGYVCDGWKLFMALPGTGATWSAATLGDTLPPGLGFTKYIYVHMTAGAPSLAAGDVAILYQSVEGYRTARFAWGTSQAKPITISFWSNHVRPGLYSVSVQNGVNNRSCVATYTHAAANVWQYNSITFQGDTTGSWPTDNSAGIFFQFTLAAGANFIASSANTWLAGNYKAAAGSVNGVASASDTFRITGVTILPGSQTPIAAQSDSLMRPIVLELMMCQRQYDKKYVNIIGITPTAGALIGQWVPHTVQMRVAPSMASTGGSYTNCNSPCALDSQTVHGFRMYVQSQIIGSVFLDNCIIQADARI